MGVSVQEMYIATFIFKLFYLILGVTGGALLHLWRWIGQGIMVAGAREWPRIDATVESSFELDESSKRVRNLLRNLFEDQSGWDSYPRAFRAAPEMNDIYDDDYGNDKSKPWVSGIHYSYHVGGVMYSGAYLLPRAYKDSGSATTAGRSWVGKRIVVRYNPRRPSHSCFLKVDGAPGVSRVPTGLDTEPYITTLSLRQ